MFADWETLNVCLTSSVLQYLYSHSSYCSSIISGVITCIQIDLFFLLKVVISIPFFPLLLPCLHGVTWWEISVISSAWSSSIHSIQLLSYYTPPLLLLYFPNILLKPLKSKQQRRHQLVSVWELVPRDLSLYIETR